MLLPYTILFYAVIIGFLSSKVEEIIDVVEFIMCFFDVFFKALELEIYLKSF